MLPDEEKNIVTATNAADDTQADAIEALNQLKQNTVSKEQYERVRADNKKLMDMVVNGQSLPQQQPALRDSDVIAKELFSGQEMSNLDFVKKALELREAVLAQKGIDIFVPSGHEYSATEEDRIKAQNTADVFQQCVDKAEGNSARFTAELMMRTNDIRIPGRR